MDIAALVRGCCGCTVTVWRVGRQLGSFEHNLVVPKVWVVIELDILEFREDCCGCEIAM